MSPPQDVSALAGVWRRESIEWTDGRRDDASTVVWLQTPRWFADVRIPPEVPRLAREPDWDTLDEPTTAALTEREGFFGDVVLAGRRCRWRRHVDYQPAGAWPDEGDLDLDGDLLLERGVHRPYREVWRRDAAPPCSFAVFVDADARTAASHVGADPTSAEAGSFLLRIGDHFAYVRDRPNGALPPHAGGLAALAGLPAWAQRRRALFGCEISYGRIHAPAGRAWRIEHSTHPWREGGALDDLPSANGGPAPLLAKRWECLDGDPSSAPLPTERP